MKHSIALSIRAGILGSLALGVAAPPSVAQESEQPLLEEILVTARFRQESAQDIGASIKGFSGDQMEKSGMISFQDIAYRTVGLDLQNRSPNQNEVSIRGVSKAVSAGLADTLTANPVVTMYLDEIAVTTNNANQRSFNLFDLDRVEILRGPQPTLFGEGSVGGTIRYFSTKPSLDRNGEFDGRINATYSNFDDGGDSWLIQGAAGTTLIEDTLGVRVSGFYRDDDGFIDNVVNGEDEVNHYENSGGRIRLLYQPTENLSIDFGYQTEDSDLGDRWEITPGSDPSDLVLANPISAETEDNFDLYSLVVDYNFSDYTLSSITGHYERETDSQLYDAGLSGIVVATYGAIGQIIGNPLEDPTTFRSLYAKDENFTQEFRLISNLDGMLNFTSGLYYQDNEFTSNQAAISPGIAPYTFMNSPVLFAGDTLYESEQLSAFVEFTAELTDSFRVIAGVRYVDEELETNLDEAGVINLPSATNFNPVFPVVYGPLFAALGLDTTFDFEVKEWLPRLALELDLGDDILLYANAARGIRSGNINAPISALQNATGSGTRPLDEAVFAATITYDEDLVDSYEIGLKSTLADGRLTANGAIFFNEWEDIQTPIGNPVYISNETDAETYGVEFELFWLATDTLSLFLNGNYTHGEYQDDVPLGGIESGNEMPGVPEYTYSLGLDGRIPMGDNGLDVTYRADYQYIGERFGSATNVPASELEELGLLNLRLGLESDTYAATLFVTNATNEIEVQASQTAGDVTVNEYVNRPRTLGISLTYSFD